MALTVNASASWNVLVQWVQGQPDKSAYTCVKEIEALSQWNNGTDLGSRVWQLFAWTTLQTLESLNTPNQKFAEFKRRLLTFLETAPSGNSFSIEQLQRIQTEIEQNETLVEMWNCTKKYYFTLARRNQVTSEFPDYVFGFTYLGTLAERVKKIKTQIRDLNRSQAFATTSHWVLRNTKLTHAFVPQLIATQFTNITQLDMSHNQFETLGDFSQLTKLVELRLTDNRLKQIAAARLPCSLTLLILENNRFETQPNLTRLTGLELLDLSDNQLSAISSRTLPPNLTHLYLRGNPLHSIANVQKAFPELEIDSDVSTSNRKRLHEDSDQ